MEKCGKVWKSVEKCGKKKSDKKCGKVVKRGEKWHKV